MPQTTPKTGFRTRLMVHYPYMHLHNHIHACKNPVSLIYAHTIKKPTHPYKYSYISISHMQKNMNKIIMFQFFNLHFIYLPSTSKDSASDNSSKVLRPTKSIASKVH